ncbi:hypothetical protein [Shinella sp.]|uniref:hypothetical protein n=1 Tax=Shinella sp. TaxID=1870904 RepID=UPI0039E68663
MAYFRQKQKNGIFVLSYASDMDRSTAVVTLKADADVYESGTVLIDITAVGADQGKFIRAAEATEVQAEAATRAVFLRDRTFAEADTDVLVVERDAVLTERLTDIAALAAEVKAPVAATLKLAGIVLR